MREIATRAGRGRISSSTVHNVFASAMRGYPGGLSWKKLSRRWPATPRCSCAVAGGLAGGKQPEDMAGSARPRPSRPAQAGPRRGRSRAVGSYTGDLVAEIPSRNLNFTGRVAELESAAGQPYLPRAARSSGSGHFGNGRRRQNRNSHRIHSRTPGQVRTSSGGFGPSITTGSGTRWSSWASGWNCGWSRGSGRDRTIAAVLEALESGVRPNWLLVYDNAAEPLDLQRYLPDCPPRRPRHHYLAAAELARLHRGRQHRGLAFHRRGSRQLPAPPGTRPRRGPEPCAKTKTSGALTRRDGWPPHSVICLSPSSMPPPT